MLLLSHYIGDVVHTHVLLLCQTHKHTGVASTLLALYDDVFARSMNMITNTTLFHNSHINNNNSKEKKEKRKKKYAVSNK